jgi:flagellar motor component MotA
VVVLAGCIIGGYLMKGGNHHVLHAAE